MEPESPERIGARWPRAQRRSAAGALPRERGCAFRLRSSVARDRPAAGGARPARHPTRALPTTSRPGQHGRGPLQDDGRGGRRDRQPRPGLGQLCRRRDHRAARGRADGRDHVCGTASASCILAAVDLPGAGPARRVQAASSSGAGPIFSWDRIPDVVRRVPRDVDGPARTGAHRAARAGPRMRPATSRACACPRLGGVPRSAPEPADARIAEVADMLAGAARPLVIAGSGVDRAGANAGAARTRRSARLSGRHVDGRPRRGPALDHPNAVLRPRRRAVIWPSDRPMSSLICGLAARQPRPAVRQVLGRSCDPAASSRSTSIPGTSA